MSQLKCPHCGFANFDVSAYCARCQRPLRASRPVPLTSSIETQIDLNIDERPPPRPRQTPQTVALSTSRMPPALHHRGIPDARRAQHSAETVIASLDSLQGPGSTEPWGTQAQATGWPPDAGRAAATPERREGSDTVIPTALPSLFRLAAAACVDLCAGLLVALAVVAVEMLMFAGQWPVQKFGVLDTLAEWGYTNPTLRRDAFLAWLSFSVLHAGVGSRYGRTLGRRFLGLMVVGHSGQALSWPKAVLRSGLTHLSALCAGAGFFWMAVDGRRRAWHDLLSGSQVVVRR
jgi:uncharacterized RDD family membrane protein YckC